MKTELKTNNAPKAIGPYSQAVKTGNQIFVSGQIPVDPKTGFVAENDISKQTAQVIENIKAILDSAGATLDNVVKTTVFLTDLNLFQSMNEIYASYFREPFPSRSCVEVSKLPKNVLIEIDVIAIL